MLLPPLIVKTSAFFPPVTLIPEPPFTAIVLTYEDFPALTAVFVPPVIFKTVFCTVLRLIVSLVLPENVPKFAVMFVTLPVIDSLSVPFPPVMVCPDPPET